MTVKIILTEPNKILRQVSEPVEKVGQEEQKLMDDMLDTMYAANGIGLAAIQIGVPKRIIVMDISKDDSKKVFANKFCQWCFARIHPNFGIGMANYWSRRSRSKNKEPQKFLGANKEWLITYCNKKLEENHYDYFIFGHRHWPIEHQLQNGSSYINLGDWLQHCTYAVFDGEKVELKKFED